jgi:uncharacterized membrane protein
MGEGLKKAFAIIGGLLIGIGVVWVANDIIGLDQDTMIIIGVVLTIFASMALYFMTKSAAG